MVMHQCPEGPSDSVSGLAWLNLAGTPPLLAASAWDKTVRIYAVSPGAGVASPAAAPKALYSHGAPALCCTMSRNACVFSGGCDNKVKMHNLQTNQTQDIGQHEMPVSSVFVCEEKSIIMSASWDKSVKFWDTRTPNPVLVCNIGAKIVAADFKYPVLAVARIDKQISLVNLDSPQATPTLSMQSNLKLQLRSISVFADKKGFAIGSIEGRCGVMYIEERSKDFPFKCHRIEDKAHGTRCYPLNDIDFNIHGTFGTAGADGTIQAWDKDCKQRLRALENLGSPVTCISYDPSCTMLAYGLSYDWHKGYAYSDPARNVNKVMISTVSEDMVKAKKPVKR